MGDNRTQHDQTGGPHSEYYKCFDEMTNGGRVFTEDLSNGDVPQRTLSTKEKEARIDYAAIITQLIQAYKNPTTDHPVAKSQEQVLQQRVVATCLTYVRLSGRSTPAESRAGRIYPEQIHPWVDFEEKVEAFKGDTSPDLDPAPIPIFWHSLSNAEAEAGNEAEEQTHLKTTLERTLKKAGIVHSIEPGSAGTVRGKPDFCVMRDDVTVSIICECKSTHNLLLPMTAGDCTSAYNRAYAKGLEKETRSPEWSKVVHPIGQLLCYMVDSKHRYGALTSGTKTYFVTIQGSEGVACSSNNIYPGDQVQGREVSHVTTRNQATISSTSSGIKVYISDAWCVGQANYLRAWAYMHSLHTPDDGTWTNPTDWITSTTKQDTPSQWTTKTKKLRSPGNDNEGKSNSPNDKHGSGYDHSGISANSCNMEYFFPLHQGAFEFTPFEDIEILGVIGYGRNGACFKVKWDGSEYAMKQFDIGRDGDTYFSNEIRAYVLLRSAWGILVPRPIFLSESFSGGVMFLGLQLGCESTNYDDIVKFEQVLKQIETEYGIRHNDVDQGRNMIVITDTNGVARVAAIDFEDWNDVRFDRTCSKRHQYTGGDKAS